MTARAYYNEVDAYAAQWIRNLIAAGLITAGDVDTRSIVDVRPDDLVGYDRCHFFAGIAVWDYALGLAGWPPGRQVWTGSCPCQPFSAAGKGGGISDERHLWPAFFHLIEQRRPATVLGEQVASKDGLDWLDLVHADLEGASYDVGATDLCAAGVGAPHIRQRLWFVAHANDIGLQGVEPPGSAHLRRRSASAGCAASAMADVLGKGLEGRDARPLGNECTSAERGGAAGVLGHANPAGRSGRQERDERPSGGIEAPCGADAMRPGVGPGHNRGPVDDFWANPDWIPCRDGKARPVEPGTFPLAHGAPARVGRLRAYGNAINAEAAAAFVSACLDVLP